MKNRTNLAGGASIMSIIVAGLSCPACFPAFAGLGAILGIGGGWLPGSGIANYIPYLVLLSVVIFSYEVYKHRSWNRYAMMLTGPIVAMSSFYLLQSLVGYNIGLGLMFVTAIYNIIKPKHKVCGIDGACEL